jgi:hypothetical protein
VANHELWVGTPLWVIYQGGAQQQGGQMYLNYTPRGVSLQVGALLTERGDDANASQLQCKWFNSIFDFPD